MMPSYHLEFILNTEVSSLVKIKNSLAEFGNNLKVLEMPQIEGEKGENFQIQIYTQDPTIIFDLCAQFGRIKSIRIKEEGR
jgi:dihydroxyacetone kinase-like predicted kinase